MKIRMMFLAFILVQTCFGQDSLVNPSKPIVKVEIKNPPDSYLDSSYTFSKKDMDKKSTEMEFFNLLNQYRKYYGLDAVILDATLSKAAEIQATYQATFELVSHTNPNEDYHYPGDRVESVGIDEYSEVQEICVKVQKIIAFHRGREIAQEALDRWVNSPPHNEAMLWKDAKKVGISFVQSNKTTCHVYATVVFM